MTEWDRRRNNFDFMRLALAVLVIYSHAFPLGTGSEANEPINRLSHGQVTGGAIAVNSFFIMSGFLITASAERTRQIRQYLKKRISRIYPAFCMAALLTLILIMPLAGAHFAQPGSRFATTDFIVQTLRLREFDYTAAFQSNPYKNSINGSAWSVQFEFWCYLGVALLASIGLLRRRLFILALFSGALVLSILFKVRGWILGGKLLGVLLGSPQLWARLLPLYLAGVVFYLYRDRIPLRGALAALSAIALLAACWLPQGWTALYPLAGTYLLFWFAFTPAITLHNFGRFGDFSYGAYLYAFPVEQLLMKAFGAPVRPLVLFLCATPLTLLVAALSWYGVERRFLQPARRKETLVHAIEEPA